MCVDLFCGLGGWSEGFLAEGYDCLGFDIECHDYGSGGYPGQLVLQDILTLHGSQFRNATCIVASPPCQNYSYMAMPWSRAKAMRERWLKDGPDNRLFDACFRIQREASEAAGRHIPMVVENVKGAQPWVGRASANYGSFFLWGDCGMANGSIICTKKISWDAPILKIPHGFHAQRDAESFFAESTKSTLSNVNALRSKNGTAILTALADPSSTKMRGLPGRQWFDHGIAHFGSSSSARKAASAQIAKIPFPLSNYIARVFKESQ